MIDKSYADKARAQVDKGNREAWEKIDQFLSRKDWEYSDSADTKVIAASKLSAFMSGKIVVMVEPVDAPIVDGFEIYLTDGGPNLWRVDIDYYDPDVYAPKNPKKCLIAHVAKIV